MTDEGQGLSQTQYDRLLDAIARMDERFTTMLNTGLASLNAAILTITEAHHRAVLEQERRNATFITQQQHEQLANRIDQFAADAGGRDARIASLEERMKEESENSFLRANSLMGYLASALITGTAVTIAFMLAHLAGIH